VKRNAKPLTVLLVTHDQPLASALSDEIWTLREGRLTDVQR
jgi:ABC-type Fe3+/spermidine/putrescine transport system ATPase subunit